MTSILISSDDHDIEASIAPRVADALGYRFVGLELLPGVASQAGVSEKRLREVLDGAVGRRVVKTQHGQLLCRIQVATLSALVEDGVVSSGLGAHLYVKDVSHIIKLRIISDASERLRRLAESSGLPLKKAAKQLERLRVRRVLWSQEHFGVDEQDPSLYDVVLQLKQIQPDRVVEVLRDMTQFRSFQPMTYSRRCLEDLLLVSRVRLELLADFPEHVVRVDGSRVVVHVKCSPRQRTRVIVRIKDTLKPIEGVGLVEVHAVGSLRALDQWATAE